MGNKKAYMLYSDKKQTELYSIVYSKKQINEENQFYEDGEWFEYDIIDDKILINEKKMKKTSFPEKPIEREIEISNVEEYSWIK